MVCSAIDTRYGVPVAIKKLFNPFTHHTIAKRCYREMKILQHLKQDNCLCLLDVFTPSERYESFTCMYLVTPLMTTDLGKVLKGNDIILYCLCCVTVLCMLHNTLSCSYDSYTS